MKTNQQLGTIALLALLALGAEARAEEQVAGVLTPYPIGTWTCVAVEIDLTSVSSLTGLEWYNNDSAVTFPEVILIESDGNPPDLTAPGLEIETVTGSTSDWSQVQLTQPVTSSTGKAYVIFRFPEGSSRTGEGAGAGPGLGYTAQEGASRVFLTQDGVEWVSLAKGATLAVRPLSTLARAVPAQLGDLPRTVDPGLLTPTEDTSQAITALVTRLDAPRPNPFNPRVEVRFSIDRTGSAELVVFDLRGRRVKTLHRGTLTAGIHTQIWEGKDDSGSAVASGVYFVQLSTETETFTQRMTLVR